MLRSLVLPLTLIAVLLLLPPVDNVTLQAVHYRDLKLTALSPSSCKVRNSVCLVNCFFVEVWIAPLKAKTNRDTLKLW